MSKLDNNQCEAIKEIVNNILATCFSDAVYGKTLKYYQEEHNALRDVFNPVNNTGLIARTLALLKNMESAMLRFTDAWICLLHAITITVRATKINTQPDYSALVSTNEAINAARSVFFSELQAINAEVSSKYVVNMPVSLPVLPPVPLPKLQRCSVCINTQQAAEGTIDALMNSNKALGSEVEKYKFQIHLLEGRVNSDLTAATSHAGQKRHADSEVERYKLQNNLLMGRLEKLESDLTAATNQLTQYRLLAEEAYSQQRRHADSEIAGYVIQIQFMEGRVKELETKLTDAENQANAYKLLADRKELVMQRLIKRDEELTEANPLKTAYRLLENTREPILENKRPRQRDDDGDDDDGDGQAPLKGSAREIPRD